MPRGQPEDTCGDHGGRRNDGEPCGRAAGWGTPNDTGKCRKCLGTSPDGSSHEGNDNAVGNDGGAPENNTNSVKHGAYAEHNSYYQNVLDDDLRAFVDSVFQDYIDRYEAKHGEPPLGIETELFRIAVTHAKDIGLDRWANEKPENLDSGHPLVDKETERDFNPEDGAVTNFKYKESVVQSAQAKLSRDRRMWLKDLGLLEDPETQKAEAIGDMDFTLSVDDKQDLASALEGDPET